MYEGFVEEIKKSIADGDTDKAVFKLNSMVKAKYLPFYINAILISSRFNRLKKLHMRDVIAEEEYSRGINRLNSDILDLVSTIENPVKRKFFRTEIIILSFIIISIIGIFSWKYWLKSDPLEQKLSNRMVEIVMDVSRNAHEKESVEFKAAFKNLNLFRADSMNLIKNQELRSDFVNFYSEVNKYKRNNKDVSESFIKKRANEIASKAQ